MTLLSELNYLDFKLDWLRCFAALSTYKDSAAAAAGRKELFFGVPERIGARAVAASGAGVEGDEGSTLLEPYGPPLVHRPLCCRVLSLGLSLEELFLPGWAIGRGSRVAAGSDYLDFKLGCFAALSTYKDSAAAAAAAAAAAGWSSRGSCTWVF